MSHYTRTPRAFTPRLAPQPSPIVYTTPTPYYNESVTRGRRQSLGSYLPSQQMYHVAASEPSRHHRSSSKSHKHRRSHSTDRHGGSRHHRHHRTPSRSTSVRYSPEVQYAVSRSAFDRIIGECRSNSIFSDHSLQSSPSSFFLDSRPPLPQLQSRAPQSSPP